MRLKRRQLVVLAVGHDQGEGAVQAKRKLLGNWGLAGKVWEVVNSEDNVQQQVLFTLQQSTKNKIHIKLSGKLLRTV